MKKSIKGSSGKTSTGWSGVGDISGKFFCHLKNNARRGGRKILEFSLTKEFLWNLFLKQDKKCAYTGIELIISPNRDMKMTTASLDRIDSSRGYVEDNVQWVLKHVNKMKWDFKEEDFIKYCTKIAENNKIKNNKNIECSYESYEEFLLNNGILNYKQLQQIYSDLNLWD